MLAYSESPFEAKVEGGNSVRELKSDRNRKRERDRQIGRQT